MRPALLALLLAACAAPAADLPDSGAEGGARDAGDQASTDASFDGSFDDGGTPAPDASLDDGGAPAPDAGQVDDTCVDPVPDAPVDCAYLDLERVLLVCDGEEEFALEWRDYERPQCPAYWTLLGRRCATLDQVAAEARCAGSCRWRASRSVSFLHCGGRNGYIVFRVLDADGEPDPECPDKYEFSDGWYDGFDDWADKHPCPDAGD